MKKRFKYLGLIILASSMVLFIIGMNNKVVQKINRDTQKNEYIFLYKKSCPTCKEGLPVIENIKRKGISVKKIEITGNKKLISKYNILMVPTLIKMNNGKEIDRLIGEIDRYDEFIE